MNETNPNTVEPAAGGAEIEAPVKLSVRRNAAEYGSDAVVDLLHSLGFRYAFLNPGSSFRGLHDSLVNYGGNRAPQVILCAHEDAAVSMAQAYANATGRASLAALHDMVGLMHGARTIYNAYCGRSPVVVLGGSGPANPALRRAIDYLHSANTQGELVRPFVKWDDEPVTAEGVIESITRAHKIATTGPKGPVYVAIDAGIQEQKIEAPIELPDVSRSCYQAPPAPAANGDAVERAVDLLLGASFPLVIGGRIGLDPDAGGPLKELVELLGAAYQDVRNYVCFPTAHAQNLTGEKDLFRQADVVLAVDVEDVTAEIDGYATRDRNVKGEGIGEVKVIDLSQNEYFIPTWARIGGSLAPTAEQLLADPVEGLKQLITRLKARIGDDPALAGKGAERAAAFGERKQALIARQKKDVEEAWDDVPISSARLIGEVWRAVKDRPWLLTLRNARSWRHGVWQFTGCGQYLGHSGGGGVGHGPGAIVGGAFAARDRGQFAVGIIGDGDFMMTSGALWTAAHYRVPGLVVIFNNASWYNDEAHQVEIASQRNRPPENAWIGTTTIDPKVDLAGLARSYGCWAEGPVTEPDELAPALGRAVAEVDAGRFAVIDVHTQRK